MKQFDEEEFVPVDEKFLYSTIIRASVRKIRDLKWRLNYWRIYGYISTGLIVIMAVLLWTKI